MPLTNRTNEINDFLSQFEWLNKKTLTKVAGDASFRSYYRLEVGKDKDEKSCGKSVILMDAPPPMEDISPFITVAEYLLDAGLSAPSIIAKDYEKGFILLEDFGDNTFTKNLQSNKNGRVVSHSEEDLYTLAIDALIKLHRNAITKPFPASVPKYSNEKLLIEANLLTEWYMPAIFDAPTSEHLQKEYEEIWIRIFNNTPQIPETIILRDYHVDNLMVLTERNGAKTCGQLDFQDAVIGSIAYDVMSLMEDARRDIDASLITAMKKHYLKGITDEPELKVSTNDFDASWAVLAVSRHAKVIGIFTRLNVRDGKPIYLEHIPRVWRLLEQALEHPILAEMKEWINRNIPKDKRIIPCLCEKEKEC
ncbi:MAG: phosphotransferase [Alphaproteobacteria bacterium]|nr:phosphotransferase [Alphaproteobacteria bacterium]